MPEQTYNWKRFWYRSDLTIQTYVGGFLHDPEGQYGHVFNPNAVPFSAIADIPCLGLIAEPGMGKSRTLEMEQANIDTALTTQGARSLWLNLREYGDVSHLIRNLFESGEFREWVAGDYRLHLFLDSLDEALLQINVLTPMLLGELRKYPVARLSLRIACRAADWPSPLEAGLRKLWGSENVQLYRLTPLRYADVIEAAHVNGVDPEAFLREVERMQAGPLAVKPVTLDMLLRIYREKGGFPRRQADLYAAGCRLLCEEENEYRRLAGHAGTLDAGERMRIAGRIAAVTVCANKFAIWTDLDRGDVPESNIRLADLRLGDERIPTDAQLRETLGTGLFSLQGSHRIGWAHQTYAEFLAAWYLQNQGMTVSQFLSLLVHSGDNARKLVPQLHETAAWVAGMVPEVFREVMRTDPEVLLRSDVATADDTDRAALVNALLSLYEGGGSLEQYGRPFHKLDHPGLADQLRPYVTDTTRVLAAREAALNMANACQVKKLLPEILALSLNPAEHLVLRIHAVIAIQAMGDEDTKAELKPLLYAKVEHDVRLQLKGRVLQILWPQHLTAPELFAALTPATIRFVGPYETFLSYDFVAHVQPADLPLALEWVAGLPSRHELGVTFGKAINVVFRHSWRYLDEAGVLPAFARAAYSRLKEHEPIVSSEQRDDREAIEFNRELFANEKKRRRLVLAIIPLFTAESRDAVWLLFSTPLLDNADIPWLVEELLSSEDIETQRKLAQLIDRLYVFANNAHFDLIYNACRSNAALAETFARFLGAVPLDSLEAKEQRETYYRYLAWQEKREKREKLFPPPTARVATCLAWVEGGNADAWWRLNEEMTLEPYSTHYEDLLKTDVRELPGWKEADEATRTRIVEAARQHVLESKPNAEEWLGTNQYPYSVSYSFHALCLLEYEVPGFVAELSPALWRKWTPVIYAYRSDTGQEEPIEHEMLRRAYQHAPDELIRVMLLVIEGDLKSESGLIHIPGRLKVIWDERIAQALLSKAQDTGVNWPAMGILVNELLHKGYEPARVYAESLVTTRGEEGSLEWKRAVVAASHLMLYAADLSWPIIWQAIKESEAFGREVITAYAHTVHRHEERFQVLSEQTLADLYIWIETQFPYAEDPKHPIDGDSVKDTAREKVGMWRDGVLRQLKQKGSPAAYVEIARIAATFPHLEWLKSALLEVQHIIRQATWTPPAPFEVLLLSQDSRRRLVQNGDELLVVIQEALGRLERQLQGEMPAAIDLWNNPGGVYSPKDENTFSDYVKRFLDAELNEPRGVVINREVVIRPGTGREDGERTDLYITATPFDPARKAYDIVTVIMEVKGCWHNEVLTAMETQLVQRYLKDNKCRHGLYLVGWFYCPQWKQPPRKYGTQQNLQKLLDEQAASMAPHNVTVQARVLNTAVR
jgi:predicted NACHT family NTPase